MSRSRLCITHVHHSPVRFLLIRRATPQALRSCSSWRRDHRVQNLEKDDNTKRPDERGRKSATWRWGHDGPFEPSRREKLWQERMERIRKMIDEDPYEALFGYSNRLLRGVPMTGNGWWSRELRVQIPYKKKAEAEADAEAEVEAPMTEKDGNGGVRYGKEIEVVTDHEYDPISNRMIKKSRETSSHRAGTLNAQAETSGKLAKPGINEYNMPAEEHTIPRFTMLKEDPASTAYQSLPNTITTQAEPIQAELSEMSTAREEYERYKAARIPSERWLAREGFSEYDEVPRTPDKRSRLEKSFAELHSTRHELAEHELIRKDLQISQGTYIPRYDAAKADKEILDYKLEVARQNRKNMDMNSEMKARDEILAYQRDVARYNIEAEQNWKLMKVKDEVYSVTKELQQVADLASKAKEMETNIVEPRERSEVDNALRSVNRTAIALDTSLERYINRLHDKPGSLQTSLQRYNKTAGEPTEAKSVATEETRQTRTHDPMGYRHSRESRQVQRLEKPAPVSYQVPTLADVFGCHKPGQDKPSQAEKRTVPPPEILDNEVNVQRTAFEAFESGARRPAAMQRQAITEPTTKVPEATDKSTELIPDSKLVEDIKKAYEEEYGEISTSHVQETAMNTPGKEDVEAVVTEAKQIQLEQAEAMSTPVPTQADPTSPPMAAQEKPAQLLPPGSTPVVDQLQPHTSTLKAPTPSKTAMYTILSYDSTCRSMTSASFSSIISPTETAIPLTVALRHLNHAGRFLARLKDLRERGFVPVHASRDLLILRQDDGGNVGSVADEVVEEEIEAGEEPRRQKQKSEPVFSGGRKNDARAGAEGKRRWKEARRERRRRFRRVVRYTAAGIVVLGAGIYIAGVGAEVKRGRKVILKEVDVS